MGRRILVFDDFLVDKSLNQEKYVQCFGCRRPCQKMTCDQACQKKYLAIVTGVFSSDKERFAKTKTDRVNELRGHEHVRARAKKKMK